MAYKNKSKKSVLNNYHTLREKITLLTYNELKGIGKEWYSVSEELDNDLLSLDTDEYRDNYLDEYLERLDKEISQLDLNSIEYLQKSLFETFVIFKFYDDEYGFLDYYYELNDWYEEIYKKDNSQDKKIQSGFRVIVGGLEGKNQNK